jgi:TonB dependent receptor
VGELVYQGVASQASHEDRDNAIEGDLRYASGAHTIGAGFYVGAYEVQNSDNSLVFPADANGQQTSNVPVRVLTGSSANNVVSSLYVGDLWQPNPHVSLDIGLRGDDLTGYTHAQQLSPRLNFSVRPNSASALHAGFARYLQVPSFLGIAPTTQSAFAGTTAAGPPGATLPLAEDDYEYDAGGVVNVSEHLTLSVDSYYERTMRYLDTGQFGVVPIFAPFNYGHGHLWGTEFAARYKARDFSRDRSVQFSGGRTRVYRRTPDLTRPSADSRRLGGRKLRPATLRILRSRRRVLRRCHSGATGGRCR